MAYEFSSSDPAASFRKAGEAMKQAGAQAAENGHEISLRMIEQAERNTREVFAAMRRVAGAGDMGEVMRIQAEFVQDQGQRAIDHAREIGELIAQMGRDAVRQADPAPGPEDEA